MIKTAALLFGIVFLLIGILGFVPAVTPDNGMLLGIFHVNTAHNIVHLTWCFSCAKWLAAARRGLFSKSSGSFMRSSRFLDFITAITHSSGLFQTIPPIRGC